MGGNSIVAEKFDKILDGVSGEYFVAAELSRQGYIASLTLRNTQGVDILCTNAKATKTVGIQVKTTKGSNRDWLLDKKSEDYYADNLFYVLVNLNKQKSSESSDVKRKPKNPDFFVVPSKIVADYCKQGHSEWIDQPGKRGQPHKDTPMRKFVDKKEEYLNKWELLGL
jgi:hypothetical protein